MSYYQQRMSVKNDAVNFSALVIILDLKPIVGVS